MKIEINNLDRKNEVVVFEKAISIEINGIKIQIIDGGLKLSSYNSILIQPKSSNLLIIKEEK